MEWRTNKFIKTKKNKNKNERSEPKSESQAESKTADINAATTLQKCDAKEDIEPVPKFDILPDPEPQEETYENNNDNEYVDNSEFTVFTKKRKSPREKRKSSIYRLNINQVKTVQSKEDTRN